MRSHNRVELIGNVTWKDELKQTEGKSMVCTFGLATNRNYTAGSGEKVEETDYHRLVAFGKLAQLCNQFVRKGRKLFVEGRLHSHSWTDNEGVQKAVTEIILSDVIFLDKKPDEETSEKAAVEPAASLNGEQLGTTNL